jgi:hypothetical protein
MDVPEGEIRGVKEIFLSQLNGLKEIFKEKGREWTY